jgi:hypothetical protein
MAPRRVGGLSAMAAASGTDSARGVQSLARAALADGDVAAYLYREAVELLSSTRTAATWRGRRYHPLQPNSVKRQSES